MVDNLPPALLPQLAAQSLDTHAALAVVVDVRGGKFFDELGITDVALCGLAKRLEEVWMPGDKDPLILPRTSEGMYLLQRIRDEAHRFAITFHRSRRSKVMLESLLDEIPQLGETRRAALLDRFGSVTAMRKASAEELASTPGIGATIAAIIFSHLQNLSQSGVDMATGEILDS